jgi:hypothetical protein
MTSVNERTIGALLFSLTIWTSAAGALPSCDFNGQTCSLDVCSNPSANLVCDPPAKACHAYCGRAEKKDVALDNGQRQEVPPILLNTMAGLQSKMLRPGAEVEAVALMLRELKGAIERDNITASPPEGKGVAVFFMNAGNLQLKQIIPYGAEKNQSSITVEGNRILVLFNVSLYDVAILKGISDNSIVELVQKTSRIALDRSDAHPDQDKSRPSEGNIQPIGPSLFPLLPTAVFNKIPTLKGFRRLRHLDARPVAVSPARRPQLHMCADGKSEILRRVICRFLTSQRASTS